METVIIDVAKWRTGSDGNNKTGNGDTCLLNSEGFMCCLGFYCEQVGKIERNRLHGRTPGSIDIKYEIPKITRFFGDYIRNTSLTNSLITINDNPSTTIEEKIIELKEIGLKNDINFEFINQ